MSVAEGAVAALMLVLEEDDPLPEDVADKLNDLADAVIEGGVEDREKVLKLEVYNVVCQAYIDCCEGIAITKKSASKLQLKGTHKCLDAVLYTLYALTPGKSEIVDEVGWDIIADSLDKNLPESTLILILKLLQNLFIKSEDTRDYFVVARLVSPLVSVIVKSKISCALLTQWCLTAKALVLCDDPQVSSNKTAERKKILGKTKILQNLATYLRLPEYTQDAATLNALLLFLSSMAVSDDLRLQMESSNILQGIHGIFRNYLEDKELIKRSLYLLKLLCLNIKLRGKSTELSLTKWVIAILAKYGNDEGIVEEGLSCCAHLTLKNANNVEHFVTKNGLLLLDQRIVKDYPKQIRIMKSTCIILRNVVENGGELGNDELIDIMIEKIRANLPKLEIYYIYPIRRGCEALYYGAHSSGRPYFEPELHPLLGRPSAIIDPPET